MSLTLKTNSLLSLARGFDFTLLLSYSLKLVSFWFQILYYFLLLSLSSSFVFNRNFHYYICFVCLIFGYVLLELMIYRKQSFYILQCRSKNTYILPFLNFTCRIIQDVIASIKLSFVVYDELHN